MQTHKALAGDGKYYEKYFMSNRKGVVWVDMQGCFS